MLRACVTLAVVLATCSAQDGNTTDAGENNADAGGSVAVDPSMMLMYQSAMSQTMLHAYMKISMAQHFSVAGGSYFHLLMQSYQSRDWRHYGSTDHTIPRPDESTTEDDSGVSVSDTGASVDTGASETSQESTTGEEEQSSSESSSTTGAAGAESDSESSSEESDSDAVGPGSADVAVAPSDDSEPSSSTTGDETGENEASSGGGAESSDEPEDAASATVDIDKDSEVTSDSENVDSDSEDSDKASLLELESHVRSFEEASIYLDPPSGDGSSMKGKAALIAAYHMYTGVKHWLHQTIFEGGAVQQEYWGDRALQMQVSALGSSLPPQILQFLYLKSFRTHMKTLKFSHQLQTISHFVMWLEDEIDVNKAFAEDSPYKSLVALDQSDDIIMDKIYAFQSFNTYALLDFQLFYIDAYLQSLTAGMSQSQGNAASFLEVEAEAKPFIPLGTPAHMQQYFFIMSMYRVMYQMYAAHSGLASVMSEHVALTQSTDGNPNNDKQAEHHLMFARQSFGNFGMFFMSMSHIDMYMGILELYSMYGAGAGGASI
jgi:hypothetical protein